MKRSKLCYVSTIPTAVRSFLSSHINAAAVTREVWVVTSVDEKVQLDHLTAVLHPLPFKRTPSIFSDFALLLKLVAFFSSQRFLIVHSIMPKTGLLAMLAAFIARVPVRIHTFTGQVWATKTGISRIFLKFLDKCIAALATHVLVDSTSQRRFLLTEGVLYEGQGAVLGQGSICGVDPDRFKPDPVARRAIREHNRIPDGDVVILFLGRLNLEKGVDTLIKSFTRVLAEKPNVTLMLVGPNEGLQDSDLHALAGDSWPKVTRVPFTNQPEQYFAAADIFCLPSLREGFGQVVVEAAACGLPAVGSRIYGITDAIEEGVSGLLFAPGDVASLAAALLDLVENPPLREKLGVRGRQRVLSSFTEQTVTHELLEFYDLATQPKP